MIQRQRKQETKQETTNEVLQQHDDDTVSDVAVNDVEPPKKVYKRVVTDERRESLRLQMINVRELKKQKAQQKNDLITNLSHQKENEIIKELHKKALVQAKKIIYNKPPESESESESSESSEEEEIIKHHRTKRTKPLKKKKIIIYDSSSSESEEEEQIKVTRRIKPKPKQPSRQASRQQPPPMQSHQPPPMQSHQRQLQPIIFV